MKVLIACEYSGTVRDAFLELGHDAYSCDILPSESNHPEDNWRHYQGDIFKLLENGFIAGQKDEWDLLIAHPPCTHLSVSGARWFKMDKNKPGWKPLHLRFEALAFVSKLMDLDIPRIAIENPVSVISSHIRKPDQTIQPYQFGHPESKRTCLWLKNLPLLKHTGDVKEQMDKLPSKDKYRIAWLGSGKGKERSKFYTGFAKAMAEQWGGLNE